MSDIRTAAERIRAGADRARQAGFPKVAASFEDEAEHILTRFDDLADQADQLPGSLLVSEAAVVADADTRSNPILPVSSGFTPPDPNDPHAAYKPPASWYARQEQS